MVKLVFKNNSEIKMTDVRSLLKSNKIKSFLINKQTLHLLETNIDQLKDILFNNISSSEIIEIISMEMGKKIKLQLEEKNKYANTGGLNGSSDSNCGRGDNQSDPYVRKSDLANFVRKSDLTEALSIFVTKADLKEELKDFVRKSDLVDFVRKEDLKEFVTKSELRDELNELRKDMVTKDEFNELKNMLFQICNRLEKIEDKLAN
jgi:hypothetical protein